MPPSAAGFPPLRDTPGTLRAGQPVDDAAEEHRVGELRAGKQNVGDDDCHREAGLRAQQSEDADAEL